MNKVTITAIASIISVVMLCIGIGIIFISPMALGYLIWYSPDNETVLEETANGPFMVSTLPTLSSALFVLGVAGLLVHGILKTKTVMSGTISK